MKKELSFEESLKRLEVIADTLEKGEISLDEMIALYSEGASLSAKCAKILGDAEVKISQLTKEAAEE